MVTKDIYQGIIKPDADDKQVMKMSRITTAVSGVLCSVAAIVMNSSGIKVLDIVYFAYSMRGALFVVVLLGIYWKKTSEKGAVWGMIATAVVGFFWVAYNAIVGHFPIPGVTETYISVITALISTVVFSLVFKKDIKADTI